jgi:hypothetical protein
VFKIEEEEIATNLRFSTMFQDTSLPLSEPVTMEMKSDSPCNSSFYFLPLSVGCEV